MDEVFMMNPAESLMLSEPTTEKFAGSGIATLRALVTLSVDQASTKLGQRAFLETLKALMAVHLGFEMDEREVRTWRPGRRVNGFEEPVRHRRRR